LSEGVTNVCPVFNLREPAKIGARHHDPAYAAGSGSRVEGERLVAGQGTHERRWPGVYQDRPLHSLQRARVAAVDEVPPAPFHERAVGNGYCPIRLKNFAALEIGRSFVNVDGSWWIVLTAAETKEKRRDERPVPQDLADFIQRYLAVHRPVLARGNSGDAALWMAMDGKPMSCASIAETIPETTETTTGVRVSPHLFRTAGVTTLATHAGDKPHAGGALLHHRP
jgi:hypothetical protein